MIFNDSRYANGFLQKNYSASKGSYELSVYRNFPSSTRKFIYHTWRAKDRIDKLAARYLGDPKLWYVIADFNPEVSNIFDLNPGTSIRIPQ